MRVTPLPFSCAHESYSGEEIDGHGNVAPKWLDPVDVSCFWWSDSSEEPDGPPTGSERVVEELFLVVDAALVVDHRDKFTVTGRRFAVNGLPKEYDHGPFGFAPTRQVVALRSVR